eukprot:scaffold139188_cov14-Tisochrysis_lutea.AAC.1
MEVQEAGVGCVDCHVEQLQSTASETMGDMAEKVLETIANMNGHEKADTRVLMKFMLKLST